MQMVLLLAKFITIVQIEFVQWDSLIEPIGEIQVLNLGKSSLNRLKFSH